MAKGYAGMVAKGGQSQVIAKAYTNRDKVNIPLGVFVAQKEDGAALIKTASDVVLGVSVNLGIKKENKPLDLLSVLSLPQGAEVWVQGKEGHGLNIGDTVEVEAKADNAGKVAKTAATAMTALSGKFYVIDLDGDLVRIGRKE